MRIAKTVTIIRVVCHDNYSGLFLDDLRLLIAKESDHQGLANLETVAKNLDLYSGSRGIERHVYAAGTESVSIDEIFKRVQKASQSDAESDNDTTPMVSVDGGQSYVRAPEGVRVVYPNMEDMEGLDGRDAELHINLTQEGYIADLWSGEPGSPKDTHEGSVSELKGDIIPTYN